MNRRFTCKNYQQPQQIKADGDKEVESESDVVVIDKVVCEGLTKDHEYTMKGWLVYKTSGDKVLIDGKPVEVEKNFTAVGEKTESGA
jgi:hypothetical protein